MNNFHICYNATNIENVTKYAGPGSIFVADFDILDLPEFKVARSKGAKLYAYRRPISRIVNATGARELQYYMGDLTKVPLWGKLRRNNDYSYFTDLRAGSVWNRWMADDIAGLIKEGVCDGAFLDVLGARPWGVLSDWANWPAAERAEWTAGAVDAMRRMHEARMATDERFELVCNNIWDLSPNGDPSDALANTGNDYCNGVCMEHKLSTSAYHRAYAGRAFGAWPRRVLALATSIDEAKAWAAVPGVTHVSPQMQYGFAEAPVVPFEDYRLDEAEQYIARLKTRTTDTAQLDMLRTQLDAALRERDDARWAAAQATGERDAAVEQRQTAQSMYDAARNECEAMSAQLADAQAACVAAAEREAAAVEACKDALARESAAATAAYNLQAKLNQVRSIVS